MSAKIGKGPVRLAVIGTGGMAHTHVRDFQAIRGCTVVAAADIDRARVEKFCAEFGIPEAYTDAGKLLAESGCDAVTIVAPDAAHAPLTLQALRAGRHVLCEKPLALNQADALRMAAAAKRAGKVNMVNFSYRNWSCLEGVAEAIRRGEIGEVRHVEASYLQSWLSSKAWGNWRTNPGWLWRLSSKHGSRGVLGDIGVHILDFATYPAGPVASVFCRLKTFHKAPRDRVGRFVLDANDSAVLAVEFANGAVGSIHTSRWSAGHDNRLYLKISGTTGAVEIDSEKSTSSFRICSGSDLDRARWKERKVAAVPTVYSRFITAIRTGGAGDPDFARGARIQGIVDACFKSDALSRPVRV